MTTHDSSLPSIDDTLLQFEKILVSDSKAADRSHPLGDTFAVCQMAAVLFGLPDVPKGGGHRMGATVEEVATSLGLVAREVDLQGDWWNHDLGVVIGVQTEGNLPILMRSNVKRGAMEFCSPNQKDKFHRVSEAAAMALQPTAYVLYPTLPDTPLALFDIMKGVLRVHPVEVLVFLALTIAIALLAYAVPVSSGLLVDYAVPHRDIDLLIGVVTVVAGCNLLMLVLRYTAEMVAQRLEGSVGVHIQAGTLDRLFRFPLGFFADQNSVSLMRRFSGLEIARRALLRMLVSTALDVVTLLVGMALMAFYFPLGALVVLGAAVVSLGLAYWLGKLSFSAYSEGESMSVNVLTVVHEMISNMLSIRVYAAQRRMFTRWRDSFIEMRRRIVRSNSFTIVQAACQQSINLVSLAIIFAIVTYAASTTAAKPVGYYVAFVGALALINGSIMNMASSILASFGIRATIKRAALILTTLPEKDHGRMRLGNLKGDVEIANIYFRYTDASPLVLHDFSLSIAAGSYVGVVGSSGGGKSTLLKLMIGLLTPHKGGVFLDGNNLSDFDIDRARQQIGVVMQDYRTVSGSVLENILADRIFSDEEILSILSKVGMGDYIKSLPMGIHTHISENSSTFSAGQIQLLALARALIGKPRMLFFDEATSALDNLSVQRITHLLDDLKITRVVFTHRINTLRNCDTILVMGRGQIVQQGTFAELENSDGLFNAMLHGKTE